jgi:hypothetical protein
LREGVLKVCPIREEGRIRDGGLLCREDCVVDATDDVTGDHGLEDAIDALERLLLYGDSPLVEADIAPLKEGVIVPLTNGPRCLIVPPRSSTPSTLVELFHFGRPFTVGSVSGLLCIKEADSGVMLCECLCPGRSGVTGV